MTQEHPITPPPELVEQWYRNWRQLNREKLTDFPEYIATQAARWGYEQRGAVNEAELQQARDEELEACCEYIGGEGEWFANPEHRLHELRAARRPKPPSLKEQALEALDRMDQFPTAEDQYIIRRALEALPDD